MGIIVYTSITERKDKERDDILCFPAFKGDRLFSNAVYSSKIYKILPHQFLDCDISIWMDGNISLLIPPEEAIEMWLKDADIAFFRHYKSKNLDWEMKWIAYKFNRRSEITKEAQAQVEHYKPLNIQKEELGMGGFIIRRHNECTKRFNEAWWSEICRWGERDQLSLPVALRAVPELKINRIDLDIKNNPYLRYEPHNYDVLTPSS